LINSETQSPINPTSRILTEVLKVEKGRKGKGARKSVDKCDNIPLGPEGYDENPVEIPKSTKPR